MSDELWALVEPLLPTPLDPDWRRASSPPTETDHLARGGAEGALASPMLVLLANAEFGRSLTALQTPPPSALRDGL